MATLNEERRAVAEKIMNRIASDPAFRTQLLDDPEGALRAAGLSAAVQKLRNPETPDVRGYVDCVSTCEDSTDMLPGGGVGGGAPPCPDSGPGPTPHSHVCYFFSWCL